MRMYEIVNVPITYPEDYDYRFNYLTAVVDSIISELVTNKKPVTWVLGSENQNEIFELVVETYSYTNRLMTDDLISLGMLKAALITYEKLFKTKFILLGIDVWIGMIVTVRVTY